jgi:SAM-dependent methyltransferase
MRERVTAEGLIAVYGRARHTYLASLVKDPQFVSLDIYEPGVSGAYRQFLLPLERYQTSFYWQGIPPGEMKEGVRNEDLMSLSFKDESFDLVVSSDIFEHIRRPWLAFKEIRRVLRKGGFHIFSVPSLVPIKTYTSYRVDTRTEQDIYLAEPYYHGDGRGGKSLVYNEFGADMFDELRKCGFQTFCIRADHTDHERLRVNAFVAQAI